MPVYKVFCYDLDCCFPSLLKARLFEEGFEPSRVTPVMFGAHIEADVEELPRLSRAVASLMLRDLRLFELQRFASYLPRNVADDCAVISRASALTGGEERLIETAARVHGFIASHGAIAVDGFMRFRLRDIEEEWAMAVVTAWQETALKSQRLGLMRLLARLPEPGFGSGIKSFRLILHPDGSAVITDSGGCRIESEAGEDMALVGSLAGIAPDELEVYDLSGGGRGRLISCLRAVFGKKLRVFSKNN